VASRADRVSGPSDFDSRAANGVRVPDGPQIAPWVRRRPRARGLRDQSNRRGLDTGSIEEGTVGLGIPSSNTRKVHSCRPGSIVRGTKENTPSKCSKGRFVLNRSGNRARVWKTLRPKRCRPDLNRGSRFCRPLPYHLATAPNFYPGDIEDPSERLLIAHRARNGKRPRKPLGAGS
jgi:hypothetical protein